VSLDILTETYGIHYYGKYLAACSEYCQVAESPNSTVQGYILGKVEGAQFDDA
jgi:N-terminal acetyltransferase B complex catalytic subunit